MGADRIRVLAAAYAAVPGATPHGAAMTAMIDGVRANLDMVTLKTEDLPHVKRIADARMFRVPVGKAPDDEKKNLYMRAVARQLDAEPYHVVHVFDAWAGKVAATHERRRSSAVLLYELATFPEPGEEGDWLDAHRITLAAANRVLVSTNAAAKALSGRAKAIDVVRPGVDVGAFDFGLPGLYSNARLLYLGPFGESRDLGTLLAALAKIREVRPVRMLMAGEPNPLRREALRAQVRKAGLSDVIDVRGEPKPHLIPGIVAAADVCIAPAAERDLDGCAPLPQPLLEHMACCRPLVVADVPGVAEVVRDEIEGLVYPAGSDGALADAVLEVLRDAVLRERIAAAAYQRVRDELSSGARRRRIREVYESLVPGSQAHDPWDVGFEEPTGLIELSESQIEVISDEGETVPPSKPPPPDTAESDNPGEVKGEKTRPRAELRRSSDTHPGLVVPDTDPGRA